MPVVKWTYKGVNIAMLRLDLIDKAVSGNKWFKLKYNLIEAKKQGHPRILTFGGAFSNHIYATAAAANAEGLSSVGVIRGEETFPLNDTLSFATDKGMYLHYISREDYRSKTDEQLIEQLQQKFGPFFLISEGGSNKLAVKGAREITLLVEEHYDQWVVPVGTGGTLAGIISGLPKNSRAKGFSALKGAAGGLEAAVTSLLISAGEENPQAKWEINHDYHFGGYAKLGRQLYDFIINFKKNTNVLLDPVYTGKMMFGIYDLIDKGFIPAGTKIIAVHTGGLQGWNGMIRRYSFVDPSLSFD